MINLKDTQQSLPTAIFALSAVLLTGTLIYILTVKVPSTAGIEAAEKKQEKPIVVTIAKAKVDQTAKEKLIETMTFSGSGQDVQTAALAQVAKLTAARRLKLVGFRPQRGIDAGAVTRLPFLVTVDGSFNNVVGFTQDLESTGTKLVVNLVQMSASDPSTDNVTANINVAAFVNQPLGNGVKNG